LNWSQRKKIANSIFETIGYSPLLRLSKIPKAEGINAEILVKLDYFNPSGSLKDRIYFNMFTRAIERGELKPGMTVLECSTGNAGAYGAKLVETPGGESDVDLALEKVREMRESAPEKYWEPGQFSNPDNVEAHYLTTGPELFDQCDGHVECFIATQGTGGTITGVGRYVREREPDVKLYAIEPAECPLLSQRVWGPHGIEGIGDGFVPRDLDVSILTGIITTTTGDAVKMAQRLSREEAIFCGISSGSNVLSAIELSRRHPELKRIVTMINDNGQRYFTTPLCGAKKEFEVPDREHPMDDYTIAELDQYQNGWEIINV
jgi:cysteine synthase A